MKRTAIVAALLALCSLGCGDATPCTTCPSVAGDYLSEWPNMPVEKSSCGTLYINPDSHQIAVVQAGSDISVTDFFGVKGYLYDSLWTDFDTVTVTTGGDVNAQSTMDLTGTFSGEEGKRKFSGTMHFKVLEDGCTLDVPVTWTQIEKAAN